MLRRALALGPTALVILIGLALGPKFDRYVLPAFDGFVYDAMADHPEVFTVAPWGYRILAPWIVHALPVSSSALGYFWLTLACLSGTVLVTGAWLRRVGFGNVAAALASLSLALSPPLRQILDYQVLVDPLALLITTLILYELAAPRVLVLMALFAAGGLTKEACLVPALALPFAFVPARGWNRGLLASLASITPGLGLALFLRTTWGETQPSVAVPWFSLLAERVTTSAPNLTMAALLSGLTLPAAFGLWREPSLLLRAQGLLIWSVTFVSVVVNPNHFSVPDLPRLSVYAWPAFLPLALTGFGFVRGGVPVVGGQSRTASGLSLLTLAGCLALSLATDPYRPAPEDVFSDPIRYLARSRETLKTARVLDAGGSFGFDARAGRFAGPITERFNLTEGRQHRWFLFEGFGEDAVYESGLPQFQGQAKLLVPILNPRDLTLTFDLEGAPEGEVEIRAAGRIVGTAPVGASRTSVAIRAASLFRGSNIVTLVGPPGVSVRIVRFEARLAPAL